MRHIDVHTHLAPQILWRAFANGDHWHGMRHEAQGEQEFIVGNGKRILINSPKVRYTPEERLADMDAEGTDVQVVSIHTPLFPYHWETAEAIKASQEVNDEIAGMTRKWPDRFAGLATLPAQDVDACHRGIGKGREGPGAQGRRAGHGGQRPELGRAALPAAVQGGRGTGRPAVLPPAAAGQHHGDWSGRCVTASPTASASSWRMHCWLLR